MNVGNRFERVEDVPDLGSGCGQVGQTRWRGFAELFDQKRHSTFFGPFGVGSNPEVPGQRIEGARVALGVLPDVEPHEREPERRRPPQQIREPPVGDDLLAGLDERSVAERDRFDQFVDRFVWVSLDDVVLRMIAGRGIRAAHPPGMGDEPQSCPLACGEEPFPNVA